MHHCMFLCSQTHSENCGKPNIRVKRPQTVVDLWHTLHALWPVSFVLLVHGIYPNKASRMNSLWLNVDSRSPLLTLYLRSPPDSRRRWINMLFSIRGGAINVHTVAPGQEPLAPLPLEGLHFSSFLTFTNELVVNCYSLDICINLNPLFVYLFHYLLFDFIEFFKKSFVRS